MAKIDLEKEKKDEILKDFKNETEKMAQELKVAVESLQKTKEKYKKNKK